jgi:peptidoglycan/xylan/chitin deacetylase (PgdA/CDA1 family)
MIPGAPEAMDLDGARSARLLFVHELTGGTAESADLDVREAREATRVGRFPGRARRVAQQVAYKLGRLGYEGNVAGRLMAAREAVLGERAGGPPRFLVRVDEFPHYRAWDEPERYGTERYERFHEIMRGAGVPYLVAALPRVSHDPLRPLGETRKRAAPRVRVGQPDRDTPTPHRPNRLPGISNPGGPGHLPSTPASGRPGLADDSRPLDDGERAMLARLVGEGVSVGMHGRTHRTRFQSPRRHSELCGLSARETAELLDAGLAELGESVGVRPRVFVPPYNRFDASQLEPLGERFRVVCGGPESIGLVGFQSTPQWRGECVYLPSYAPFYGHAAEVRPAVGRAIEREWGLWIPVVLHWGWEADAGWGEMERLAADLAPWAARWEDFLTAVERSEGWPAAQGPTHASAQGPHASVQDPAYAPLRDPSASREPESGR